MLTSGLLNKNPGRPGPDPGFPGRAGPWTVRAGPAKTGFGPTPIRRQFLHLRAGSVFSAYLGIFDDFFTVARDAATYDKLLYKAVL